MNGGLMTLLHKGRGGKEMKGLKSAVQYIIIVLLFLAISLPHALAQSLDEAERLNQQVIQLYKQGRYDEAIHIAKEVLAIYEKTLGSEHPDTATSLNNLAALYRTTGRYEEAEPLYKRSLAIREKALGPEHPDTATSLNNLALLYETTGRYAEAEPFMKRALAIHEKALGKDHPTTATSLNNLAELYRTTGRYAEAEPLMKQALAISEKALGPEHPDTAISLNNLAALYRTTGRYEEAEPLYKRSLAIREKALGPEHPDTAGSLSNLALLYLESGRLDEGYRILKQQDHPMGLGKYYLLTKDYRNAEKEFNRSLSYGTGQPHFLIADHIGLGLSYEGMKDYAKAKEHFREAMNITESQWKTLSPDAKKNFLTAQVGIGFTRIEAYEGLVRVLIHEKGKGYEKASFTVAESVKGRLFLEMLATREIRGRTKEDDNILKKDREFQRALMSLRKQLEVMETKAKGVSPEEIERIKKALSDKEKEYTSFIEEVKLKGGELSSLITADPLSPGKLQSLLDPDTSFLEYMTTRDRTYAWLITKHDIRVYEIPVTEKALKEKVDTLLLPDISNTRKRGVAIVVVVPKEREDARTDEERQRNRQQFTTHAKDLSALLTLPIEKDIKTKNLIVVPHGVLHKLPFSLLTDNRYSLSVMPAASVMEFVVNKRKPGKDSLFLIANPVTDYIPLEYAEMEGKTVSLLFPKKEIYMKEKATETIVKKRSSPYNIIHFASHGEFNERQPLQSGLVLAKDTENDGFLQVHEIFSLNLPNANLVTLSACETALARIQGGDDMVGLSRGFIYAGTPSLLATLWSVDDQSTYILMEHFYKNWLKGMSKPEALRQAQISLKNMPQYRHPFYWAPFVMIGDWK